MRIGDAKRFVFVHIGKTGGTSISRALAPWCSAGPWERRTGLKHAAARRIRRLFFPRPDGASWEDYFSFCVVRNPWERLHSNYYYQQMSGRVYWRTPLQNVPDWKRRWHLRMCRLYQRRLSFAAWLDEFLPKTRPQLDFVRDHTGANIVNRILRYETLPQQWPAICARIGIDPPALPHVNPSRQPDGSPRPDYRGEYTPQMARAVAARFAEEINRWGWTFD